MQISKLGKYIVFTCASTLGACVGGSHNSASSVETAPTFESHNTNYFGRRTQSREGLDVDEFRGIPFAKPPVSDLRWHAPQPLEPVSEKQTKDATNFAPACMQGSHIANWYKGVIDSFGGASDTFPTPEVSEDCLYLNIWRPADRSDEALPIFVYVHGGSNKGGWAYEPNYLGQELAAKGVIVVNIAYRLGVFGFFSHPELDTANFALQDQIMALQWIKENIASLGGDPSRVTVAGESAGASNIAYLMASPTARGLFHRAIHQSAGWAMYRTALKKEIEPLGRRFAEQLTEDSNAPISMLRSESAEAVLAASTLAYQSHFFDPVIDDHTVVKPLFESARLGELSTVDLMIGTNANEARMYLNPEQTIESWLTENMSGRESPELLKAILRVLHTIKDPVGKLDQLATGANYTCPSMLLAQHHATAGNRTWFYHFTKVREGNLAQQMGAYHGAELPYVFNTHDDWLPTNSEDRALSQTIMQFWVNFARSGNPNSTGLIEWPEYDANNKQAQTLGFDVNSGEHPSASLCALIK